MPTAVRLRLYGRKISQTQRRFQHISHSGRAKTDGRAITLIVAQPRFVSPGNELAAATAAVAENSKRHVVCNWLFPIRPTAAPRSNVVLKVSDRNRYVIAIINTVTKVQRGQTMSGTVSERFQASTNSKRHDWLETSARWGYTARGVIYSIVGLLGLLSAFGAGGGTTGAKGAIAKVLQAPGGWLIVAALALGLIGYSVWRFVQAVFDADAHGTGAKALVIRSGLLISSLTHLLLAVWAGKLAIGQASAADRSGESNETLVAMLMSHTFGHWLVAAVGLILIGVGIAQFLKGKNEKFERHFTWDRDERAKMIVFCKIGLYARGVIFAIIGGFIIYAAVTTNPENAGGLPDALRWLRGQPFGPWLLSSVSVGLICFGVYSFVEAAYRRVSV